MNRFLVLIPFALLAPISAHPPPSFEQNNGQFPDFPRSSFIARTGPTRLALTPAGPVWLGPAGQRITMALPGAHWSNPIPATRQQQISNYYLGPIKLTNIPHFAQVTYNDIYPGINLTFHPTATNIEYDFHLSPNANPALIRLHFPGAQQIQINNGDLLLQTDNFQLRHRRPIAHQNHHPLPVTLILNHNEITFQLTPNPAEPLTIDPVVEASTLLGESGDDTLAALAIDPAGNIYAAGNTATDVFLRKLSPDAKTVLFTTYLGGSQKDTASSLALDSAGNPILAGETLSPDFPVTPGAFTTPHNNTKVFLAKFSPSGAQLFATRFGGAGRDFAPNITTDPQDNIFLTGRTWSTDFPTTPNAYNATSPSGDASYILKLNPSATAILYAAHAGGVAFRRVALDANNAALLAGTATTSGLPTTPGVIKPATVPLPNDIGYILKLNPAGTAALLSTYFGGSNIDTLNDAALDAAGNIYLAGRTYSSDFPVTPNTIRHPSTGSHGFIARLDPAATTLQYATLLGNNSGIKRIAVEPSGIAHIIADAFPDALPPNIAEPLIANFNSQGPAALLARLDPAGTPLDATYWYGPAASAPPTALTLATPGIVVFGGATTANTFPVTPGATRAANPETNKLDAYLTRVNYNSPCAFTVNPTSLAIPITGAANTVTVTTAPNCPWTATSTDTWIETQPLSDTQLRITVPANTGTARTGFAFIAGKSIPIGQSDNCTYNFQGQTQSFPASGGSPFVPVVAGAGCPWSATVDQPWVTLQPSSSGLTLQIAVNHTNAIRTATITIAPGATLIVQQAASGCTFTVPATVNVPYSTRQPFAVPVTTGPNCAWSVAALPAWLTTTAPNVNTGPLAAPFTAAANNNGPARSATIQVAGQPVTITQIAGIGNQPEVAPITSTLTGTTNDTLFLATDADGYTDIARIYFQIHSAPAVPPNTCHGFYLPATRSVYLYNDALTTLTGPLPLGANATLSNSQCTISGAASRIDSESGDTLRLRLNITLTQPFLAPGRTLYAWAQDQAGNNTGWRTISNWSPATLSPPVIQSVTPAAPTANPQTFTITVNDPDGAQDINRLYFLLNTSPNVTINGCHGFYDRALNAVYLYNDALTNLTSLTNSQCSVTLTSVTTTNTSVTLTLTLSRTSATTQNLYLWATDNEAKGTGWVPSATWTTATPPPTVISAAGTLPTVTITATNTARLYFLLAAANTITPNTCHGFYDRALNAVYLYNDALTNLNSPTNSQCTAALVSATVNGAVLTLTLNVTPTPIYGATPKTLYFWPIDSQNNGTGWLPFAQWTPPAQAPFIVDIAPFTLAANPETITIKARDPDGAPDIQRLYFLVATTNAITPNTCHGYYDHPTNAIVMIHSAGCTVNFLTATQTATDLDVTFKIALTNQSQTLYAWVTDFESKTSGWAQRTWLAATPPIIVSATPNNVTSPTQTLTITVRDSNGATNINRVYFLIESSQTIPQNTCHGFYDRATNTTFLYNNVLTGPAPNLQNTQCSLTPITATATGTDLILTMTATLAISTPKHIYFWAVDNESNGTGWVLTGTWSTGIPEVPSITPAQQTLTGATQSITILAQSFAGAANIARVYFLLNPNLAIPQNTCHGFYDATANAVYLYDDTLSSLASQQNSQCAITNWTRTLTGNQLTLVLNITRRGSYLTTTQNFYAWARDYQGGDTGWIQLATWLP